MPIQLKPYLGFIFERGSLKSHLFPVTQCVPKEQNKYKIALINDDNKANSGNDSVTAYRNITTATCEPT